VLPARRVTPSQLGPGLRQLLEALLTDGADGVGRDPYFFELRDLLDGDVDIRGHSPLRSATVWPPRSPVASSRPRPRRSPRRPVPRRRPRPATRTRSPAPSLRRSTTEPEPCRLITAGRRRHDALVQLLHDLAGMEPGTGSPTPPRLTIIATLGALQGRLGALPAQLTTCGRTATLTTAPLQRLACCSDLHAVTRVAAGRPGTQRPHGRPLHVPGSVVMILS
jgi:hypothetical protein